jgi:hypothetical protein
MAAMMVVGSATRNAGAAGPAVLGRSGWTIIKVVQANPNGIRYTRSAAWFEDNPPTGRIIAPGELEMMDYQDLCGRVGNVSNLISYRRQT